MKSWLTILAMALLPVACGPATETASPDPAAAGQAVRIVSLDYCADQYVLKLVDRERILAVSPDATSTFSYMREAAKGLRTIRPRAEDVLVAQPDLVVRSYGGGPGAAALFQRAGVPVLNVGWVANLDDVKRVTMEMAESLGERQRGEQLVSELDARLLSLHQSEPRYKALYMTPSGVTSGPGSLIHEMLLAAGLSNFQEQPGWRSLPLERLAYETPDLVAAAFFESHTNHKDAWSAMRHPMARRQMRDIPTVNLQGAWTSCGGWFLMDAIEALAQGVAK